MDCARDEKAREGHSGSDLEKRAVHDLFDPTVLIIPLAAARPRQPAVMRHGCDTLQYGVVLSVAVRTCRDTFWSGVDVVTTKTITPYFRPQPCVPRALSSWIIQVKSASAIKP